MMTAVTRLAKYLLVHACFIRFLDCSFSTHTVVSPIYIESMVSRGTSQIRHVFYLSVTMFIATRQFGKNRVMGLTMSWS